MNKTSEVLTTLIHYKSIVRDTLEYAIPKDSYDMKAYEERKRAVLAEVDQPTPLKSILDSSGDNGEKLEKAIRDFHADVYGDGSTIVKPAEDGLRVDGQQALSIFKGALPIHENVESMCRGIIADAKKQGIDVAEAEAVDSAEERFYRGAALSALAFRLSKLFSEFNQAMNENKGAPSPASHFIENDLKETIDDVMVVKESNRITDLEYHAVQDKVLALIENMSGRRDLPAGVGFDRAIKETQDAASAYANAKRDAFIAAYNPLVKELLEQVKADGAENKKPAQA
jgi:hypothetical protein